MKTFPKNIDVQKLSLRELTYWCPEEVINTLVAEQKGEVYKYKKPVRHWFYFICTSKGECGMISGIKMEVWLYRNVMEGNIESMNYSPKISKEVAKRIKEYITSIT